MKTFLLALLVVTNLGWVAVYHRLDRNYMQEMGLRDQADEIIRQAEYIGGLRPNGVQIPDKYPVYEVRHVSDSRVKVVCHNGGDAAILPPDNTEDFGYIVVDCGK